MFMYMYIYYYIYIYVLLAFDIIYCKYIDFPKVFYGKGTLFNIKWQNSKTKLLKNHELDNLYWQNYSLR